MKRTNFKRKVYTYIVIWSVFIGSLLLYSPDNIAFSATGAPEIKITAPSDGSVLDVSTVEITGSISDDNTTPDKLSVKVMEQQSNSDPIDITSGGKLTVSNKGTYADFSYSKDFSEGPHTLDFIVADESGTTSELTWTFTIKLVNTAQDTTVSQASLSQPLAAATISSPSVVEKNLIKNINDTSSYLPAENMTQVPLDYQIRLVLQDNGTPEASQPVIKVQSNTGKEIAGTTKLEGTDSNNNFIFTFTPTTNLEPKTIYFVYLNPTSTDLSTIPCLFKFTTTSEDAFQFYKFANDQTNYTDPNNKRQPDYIHGQYSLVTNSCDYCHNTHNGKNEMLEGGKYGDTNNNLCKACHDGTIAAPIDTTSSSHQDPDPTKFDQTRSCTTCHDPHADWSVSNPNLLAQ